MTFPSAGLVRDVDPYVPNPLLRGAPYELVHSDGVSLEVENRAWLSGQSLEAHHRHNLGIGSDPVNIDDHLCHPVSLQSGQCSLSPSILACDR